MSWVYKRFRFGFNPLVRFTKILGRLLHHHIRNVINMMMSFVCSRYHGPDYHGKFMGLTAIPSPGTGVAPE